MSEVNESEQTNRPTAAVEERTTGGVAVDGRKVRGVVPYGVESRDLGGWREIIEPTAFRNTDVSELRALIDHKGIPLGRYPGTLEVEDRSDGLHWHLDPPKSRADLVEAIERGDLRSGSWRMVVAKDEWRGDVRHVHEISELLDVTLVGAEQPAYPQAAVEYRSKPRVTNEPNEAAEERQKESNMDVEDRSSQEEQRGNLNVEDRHEVRSKPDFLTEVADFASDVKKGEARALSTAISLSNPEYGDSLFDLMRPISAYLRSGVRALSTDSDSVIYPMLTRPHDWLGSGGGHHRPIGPDVRGRHRGPAQAGRDRPLQQRGGGRLGARARGRAPLHPRRQGGGVGRHGRLPGFGCRGRAARHGQPARRPHGQRLRALHGQHPLGGLSDLHPRGERGPEAVCLRRGGEPDPRAARGADRQRWQHRRLPVPADERGGAADLGCPGLVAPHLAAGTAYFYSPSQCYVVNRTSGFEIEIDRSRLFNSDESEMRLKARLDFFFPYSGSTGAIVKGTAVPS